MLTLLVSLILVVGPFTAPALADDRPRPPAVRTDAEQRASAERQQRIADEERRRAEVQRAAGVADALAKWQEVERQNERVRKESLAAAQQQAKHERDGNHPKTAAASAQGVEISLRQCTDSVPQEAVVPLGTPLTLVGFAWTAKTRGLVQSFIGGVDVEASIGGVPIANAGQYLTAPTPGVNPTFGNVWSTRWEYPLTLTTPGPLLVHLRWTLQHQVVDLLGFDESGAPIRYAAGTSVERSCTLVSGVAVTGRITGAGLGLADGRVAVHSAAGVALSGVETNASGDFTLLLRPGDYKFLFLSAAGPWLPEWWENRPQLADATIVTIALGVTPPLLIADLERGVFLSGRVTGADTHQGVANVDVGAQRIDIACCDSVFARSDADGRYRMVVRRNVLLKVAFFPGASGLPYVQQWWNGRRTFDEADLLSVGTADIPNIDAVLELGVFVRGRVTDAQTGLPLMNVGVSGSAVDVPCCENFFAATDAQGQYALAVRRNISILVGFFPPTSSIAYIPSYWHDKRSFSEADRVVVGALDVVGIDAAIQRGVYMRGRVTDAETHLGIANVTVIASGAPCCESFFAQTAPDGSYTAAVRKNTTLTVQFYPPFGSVIPYVTQWFHGRTSATTADPVVVATVDVAAIDAALERGVFVRGHITDAVSGAAVPLANVNVSPVGAPCCDNSFASADAHGDYAVAVRKNTAVNVLFSPPFGTTLPYLPQWYNAKTSFETADVLTVGTNDVTGINAVLQRGVFLSGRVTDAISHLGIPGLVVNALVDGVSCCENYFANTDSRGDYRMVVRRGIGLKINFNPPFVNGSTYIGQWYNGKGNFNDADVVLTGSIDITGIDAALERGVLLRGRVTDALSGLAVANANVAAQRTDVPCCEQFFASTDAQGFYAMAVRRSVTLAVGFSAPFNDPIAHLNEWWHDRRNFSEADPVPVGTTDVSGIDAALERGVFVRGRVTSAATGLGLPQVSANAFVVDAPCCENYFGFTNDTGNYAMAVRPNVSLKINFFPPFGTTLLSEYYNDKSSFGAADVVAVGASDVGGIDAALENGVTVSGRVTDASGAGLSGVNVSVEDVVCCNFFAGSQTGGDGGYSVAVRPGSYKIAFFPPFGSDYLFEFYDDQPDFNLAQVVVVGATPVSGIDAVLERGVLISGRVRDPDGNGVPFVGVNVENVVCCTFVAGTGASNDGTYSLAVRPGSYKISFYPQPSSDLILEYYNDKPSFDTADVLTAVVGTPLTNIDATLERGTRLSGRVTDAATGSGLGGIFVGVQAPVCCVGITGVQSSPDGSYAVVLRAGSYKVGFFPPPGSPFRSEYYNNKTAFDLADVVVVGAAPVGGIDAALEPAADTLAPLVVDAQLWANPGGSDFLELGDAFTLTFSEPMNTATLGAQLFIKDQDGTLVRLDCGTGVNNVACVWDPPGVTVSITVAVPVLDIPIAGTPNGGTTPGLQIPFDLIGLGGFVDLSGNLPNLIDSLDLLVD